jgi:undecaprenyl-diphosphatase
MPGLSKLTTTQREEEAVLTSPWRAAVATAGVVALTAVVFVLVAVHGTLSLIKQMDDAWLRLMISGRTQSLTGVAKVFNVIGLVYVTLPVWIALVGFLATRRRWWHLVAFTTAVAVSELMIGPLKGIYDRPRPPGSLIATSGGSFPSGHAVAASVTVIAAVIAFVPAGRRRALWGAVAVAFAILMGLSRAYLAAHWLSDAAAGILLGTSCALVAALAADLLQRRWNDRRQRACQNASLHGVVPTRDTEPGDDQHGPDRGGRSSRAGELTITNGAPGAGPRTASRVTVDDIVAGTGLGMLIGACRTLRSAPGASSSTAGANGLR